MKQWVIKPWCSFNRRVIECNPQQHSNTVDELMSFLSLYLSHCFAGCNVIIFIIQVAEVVSGGKSLQQFICLNVELCQEALDSYRKTCRPLMSTENCVPPPPHQHLLKCLFTQFPESRHHVNKRCNAVAEGLWQVGSEVVAQGEQVVGQVHAVVVLNGSEVRELEQVLPGGRSGEDKRRRFRPSGDVKMLRLSWSSSRDGNLLVVSWYDIVEQLENVSHSEEELGRAENRRKGYLFL